jgi:hypothetical protein
MEFWFALANVFRVLLATIEHPLPLSRTPQDSVWFLLTDGKRHLFLRYNFFKPHFLI